MKKKEKMPIYNLSKLILGPIYKFWYNPKIVGMENIIDDKNLIIVGNHIHIMDQCNLIVSTKRKIHYLAKKEYFDSKYKEGKFSWFFKGNGCIPVDRSKKDLEAVSIALDVLNNNQVLGLFPEGTRNALKVIKAKEIYEKYKINTNFKKFYKSIKHNKTSQVNYLEKLYLENIITKEEFINHLDDVDAYLKILLKGKIIKEKDYYDNLFLPFKFGAVSMAKKTNSLMICYVITGEYKFRSKNLKVLISKPFKVGKDLEEANQKLRKIMIDLYKKNEK